MAVAPSAPIQSVNPTHHRRRCKLCHRLLVFHLLSPPSQANSEQLDPATLHNQQEAPPNRNPSLRTVTGSGASQTLASKSQIRSEVFRNRAGAGAGGESTEEITPRRAQRRTILAARGSGTAAAPPIPPCRAVGRGRARAEPNGGAQRRTILAAGGGVIYVDAINKDVGYIHAVKKFSDTCMPWTQNSLTCMPFRPTSELTVSNLRVK
jgi:hypothetical protein